MIPVRSAPCRAGLLAVFCFLVVAPGGTDVPAGTWIETQARGAQEAALKNALSSLATDGAALKSVSQAHPGTLASGLAQLALGFSSLGGSRPAEALPFLQHPDVAKTAVADYALLATGRAFGRSADLVRAADAYRALLKAHPGTPLVCAALVGAAESLDQASRPAEAVPLLERVAHECPHETPSALLQLATLHEHGGRPKAAAEVYDRLDRDFPASPEARSTSTRLHALAAHLPALTPAARNERDFKRATALSNASLFREAVPLYRSLLTRRLTAEHAAEVRVRLGRALLALKRDREAAPVLGAVPKGSPSEAEAAYFLARIKAKRQPAPPAYEDVVARFPKTPWAEDALLALSQHYQKDALEDQALPYYRRLLADFPDGRYADRATWRVAWWEFRTGHHEAAAEMLEKAARTRPDSSSVPGFLYWAGRSRAALGQQDRAHALYAETVQRFKHTYHGLKATEALGLVSAGASSTRPAGVPGEAAPNDGVLERARQLLLIDRFAEASDELRTIPQAPKVQATLAWIEWKQGRLRPAITAMKRAFPQWKSEEGDSLPDPVWRILYPLEYADALRRKAQTQGLDPALVAAIIWQESTFDPWAVSSAGARGLMQVIPPTGRSIARALGVTYRARDLHDPEVSLTFGTHYLKGMLGEFDGRTERALAAYNAGPHRVAAWTAAKPDMSAEEFIESIPFTETRSYVMNILTHMEHYRRIYGLTGAPQPPTEGATTP